MISGQLVKLAPNGASLWRNVLWAYPEYPDERYAKPWAVVTRNGSLVPWDGPEDSIKQFFEEFSRV